MLAGAAPDKLVIPDYFLERERNILLRLERNNPFSLLLADSWQLHEARENAFFRDGVIDVSALDLEFSQHLAHRGGDLFRSHALGRRIDKNVARQITTQDQPARRLGAKFRELDALRTKIERDDACPGGHLDGGNWNLGPWFAAPRELRQAEKARSLKRPAIPSNKPKFQTNPKSQIRQSDVIRPLANKFQNTNSPVVGANRSF